MAELSVCLRDNIPLPPFWLGLSSTALSLAAMNLLQAASDDSTFMPTMRRAGYLAIIAFAASAFQVSIQPDCGPAHFGLVIAMLVLVVATIALFAQEDIRRSEMVKLPVPAPVKRKH